jgi:hypothetical protein
MVFSTACDSASITSTASKSGKQGHVGWLADSSHVVFGKKFLVKSKVCGEI